MRIADRTEIDLIQNKAQSNVASNQPWLREAQNNVVVLTIPTDCASYAAARTAVWRHQVKYPHDTPLRVVKLSHNEVAVGPKDEL